MRSQTAFRSIKLLPLLSVLPLLVLACEPPNAEEGNETDTETDSQGGSCEPAGDGVDSTFSVELTGFPEVSNNELSSTGLDFMGPCTLDTLTFEADTLSLSLSCEHPEPSDPDGAKVTITTAASGIPSGLSEGDSLTFKAYASSFESEGGDQSGEIFRALTLADSEFYSLSDELGPIFGGTVHGLSGTFGPITVLNENTCAGWNGCSGNIEMDIRGYIEASAGETSIDVQVGEVGVLESGGEAWDVSLFQSWLIYGDCHDFGYGAFSVVRQPA